MVASSFRDHDDGRPVQICRQTRTTKVIRRMRSVSRGRQRWNTKERQNERSVKRNWDG
jgi:hypothetical protein